jgi:hypothetical protein
MTACFEHETPEKKAKRGRQGFAAVGGFSQERNASTPSH